MSTAPHQRRESLAYRWARLPENARIAIASGIILAPWFIIATVMRIVSPPQPMPITPPQAVVTSWAAPSAPPVPTAQAAPPTPQQVASPEPSPIAEGFIAPVDCNAPANEGERQACAPVVSAPSTGCARRHC